MAQTPLPPHYPVGDEKGGGGGGANYELGFHSMEME